MTGRITLILVVLATLSLAVGACCHTKRCGPCGQVPVLQCGPEDCGTDPDADLIATTYCAVDTLLANAREELAGCQKIVTTTFVDLNDMQQTYPFGRLSGELAAARLSHHGLAAVNLNIRNDSVSIVEREGQFLLSRDIEELAAKHCADAALVGTFTESDETVFVSQRLVNIHDSTIIGAIDYEIPKGPKLRSLLTRTFPGGSWASQSW
jgi:TolB-like protein